MTISDDIGARGEALFFIMLERLWHEVKAFWDQRDMRLAQSAFAAI